MNNMFDIPPRCPAVADKITAMFSWKHTYHVHQKQKEVPKNKHLHKTYSLQLPITRRKSVRFLLDLLKSAIVFCF